MRCKYGTMFVCTDICIPVNKQLFCILRLHVRFYKKNVSQIQKSSIRDRFRTENAKVGYLTRQRCLFVQVHYVDHGFSEVISKTKVFELHEKFFQLPFQASKCKLAGDERIRTASVPLTRTRFSDLGLRVCASRLGAVLSGTRSAEEIRNHREWEDPVG